MIVLGPVHFVAAPGRCEEAFVVEHGVDTACLHVWRSMRELALDIAAGLEASPLREVKDAKHGTQVGDFHFPGECPLARVPDDEGPAR